jgi:hypothetical protein
MRRALLVAVGASLVLAATFSSGASAQRTSESAIGAGASTLTEPDSIRPRPRAIEYSDAYGTRLKIHRIGSYVMLPLFAGEYVLGDRLLQQNHADWLKPAHGVVAAGLGILFVTNTVTGVWNLAESWNDPNGRPLRLIHSALMLAADAGFAYTGLNASDASESPEARNRHKNSALVSIGISTVGTVIMWLGNK